MKMLSFIRSLFAGRWLFYFLVLIIILFIIGYLVPVVVFAARISLILAGLAFVLDLVVLHWLKTPVLSRREVPNRLSNGDVNEIKLYVQNKLPVRIFISIIDELPVQFQIRDFDIRTPLDRYGEKIFRYDLRPVQRGEYKFGQVHIFVQGLFGMVVRRISNDCKMTVPVYPSFIQMRRYELLASSSRSEEVGIKKIRRLGQHSEFENIRNYVIGDDYRSVNWKSTARQNKLMVNQYQEERAQEVYNVIDLGRIMRLPFNGLTLLDYAINASLVISNIALLKYDKAGLLTFSTRIDSFLPAEAQGRQLQKILDHLYRIETGFLEPDYELMYMTVRRYVNRRSLIILYTNFESLVSLERNLPVLKKLAANHLVLVILFENTEIKDMLNKKEYSIDGVYTSIIAENFLLEKKLIVKELNKNGIQALLTAPEALSINLINKYLEFKALGWI
jgi:uncharacterized protein (DUF58 family)